MGGGTQNCGFHSRHSRVITYWVGCWGIRTAGLWGCSAKVGWGSVLRQEKWCHGRRDWPGKIYIWFEYDFCDTWAFKHLVQIYWEVVFPEFLRGFSRYRGFTSLPISEHFHFFFPPFLAFKWPSHCAPKLLRTRIPVQPPSTRSRDRKRRSRCHIINTLSTLSD